MILNLCHLNFFDVKFVSAKQKSVLASAVGTDFAVFNGRIIALAVSAKGNCVDSFHQKLTIGQNVVLFDRPVPAIDEMLRNDGGYLADLKSYAVDVLNIVFRGNLFNIVYDVKYNAEFVHGLPLKISRYLFRSICGIQHTSFRILLPLLESF